MYIVVVNRAPTINSPKQWTVLVTLNWDTNGIVTKEIAEQACVKLKKDDQSIECKVQLVSDLPT